MSTFNSNKDPGQVEPSDGSAATSLHSEKGTENPTRRRLAKLGVGAPILMSLASRPVLAHQCLSNMLSGNLSQPDRGSCSLGWSPGGWGQPGGNIFIYSTLDAWTKAGFSYGVLSKNATNTMAWDSYSGGTRVHDKAVPSALVKEWFSTTVTMREVINAYPSSLTRHFLTAYLNASLSEANTNDAFKYALTKKQVVDLALGNIVPPAGMDLKSFLDSTWS